MMTTANAAPFRRAIRTASARPLQRLGCFFSSNAATDGSETQSPSSSSSSSSSDTFTVGITGSGGLVGTALRDELLLRRRKAGGDGTLLSNVRVVRLSRGESAERRKGLGSPAAGDETWLRWNPYGSTPEEVIDLDALTEMDAIVHLAGENVATGGLLGLGLRPWTKEKKAEIVRSRVVPTTALASAIAAVPKPQTFLVASGIGAYGDHFIGDSFEAVDESAATEQVPGFLAEVSRQWEAAAAPAVASNNNNNNNNRVVNMRFGVVLSKKGGALAKLYPIFLLCGGGVVGSGEQYMSFISARDHARAIVHALETPALTGPVNFCSPEPCTNAKFTKTLGKVLARPTVLPLPSFAVKLLFGEMGEEMLLGGVRAVPTKLLSSGFTFLHPTIEQALRSAMEEVI